MSQHSIILVVDIIVSHFCNCICQNNRDMLFFLPYRAALVGCMIFSFYSETGAEYEPVTVVHPRF